MAIHFVRGQPDGDMGGQQGLQPLQPAPRDPRAAPALPEPADESGRDVGYVPESLTEPSLSVLLRSKCCAHCPSKMHVDSAGMALSTSGTETCRQVQDLDKPFAGIGVTEVRPHVLLRR